MTDETTHLGLGKPTVGADSDDWGGILNADLDQLDALWATIGDNAFGTAAVKNVGTSGAAVPLLSTANTWGGAQSFSGGLSGALTGNVTGNVTGNCSGSSGSCTGNAATATTAGACSGNAASATTATTATAALGLSTPAGWTINDDGAGNLLIKKGATVVGLISPSAGFTNEV
jgi:hypothetical protein